MSDGQRKRSRARSGSDRQRHNYEFHVLIQPLSFRLPRTRHVELRGMFTDVTPFGLSPAFDKLIDLAQSHRDALEVCLDRLHSHDTASGQFHVRVKREQIALYRGAKELRGMLKRTCTHFTS